MTPVIKLWKCQPVSGFSGPKQPPSVGIGLIGANVAFWEGIFSFGQMRHSGRENAFKEGRGIQGKGKGIQGGKRHSRRDYLVGTNEIQS